MQNHKVLGQNPDSNRNLKQLTREPFRTILIMLFCIISTRTHRFHRKNMYYHPNKRYKSADCINFTA